MQITFPPHPRPIAAITGGSRGIGRSIVERLHADGYGVLFTHSASDDEAHDLESSLHSADAPCRALRIDVASDDAPAQIFDAAESLGLVTSLINNAGITSPIGELRNLTDTDLNHVLAVNLRAPVRLCREAARRWSGRGKPATIINISSIAARTGSPNEYVVYAATKAALETLSVGLAKELAAHAIRVNAVSPGIIDTTFHARAGEPGRAHRLAERIPLKRPGTPEEIAEAVAWLASDKASYVTGTVLSVSGGF